MAVIPGCEAVEQVGPTTATRAGSRSACPARSAATAPTSASSTCVEPERAGLDGTRRGHDGLDHAAAPTSTLRRGRTAGPRWTTRAAAVIGGPLARLDSRFAERLAESLIAQGLAAPSTPTPRLGHGGVPSDGLALLPARLGRRGAGPARGARAGAAGHGRRHGRHAAINEGISLPATGHGPAPRRPRPASSAWATTLRIGATTTADPPARAGRRPAAARRPRGRTASWSIRNMATVGGNLFTPPPGGDVAVGAAGARRPRRGHGAGRRPRTLAARPTSGPGFMTTAPGRRTSCVTAIIVPLDAGPDGVRQVRPQGRRTRRRS